MVVIFVVAMYAIKKYVNVGVAVMVIVANAMHNVNRKRLAKC